MSEVQRICPNCGEAGPLTARFCPHCGNDRNQDPQAALPMQRINFPITLSMAALPILAGAASLVLRAGWKLLQSRMAASVTETAVTALRTAPSRATQSAAQPPMRVEQPVAHKPRQTIRIRSAWAVTDGNGVQRSGVSEHQIEIDD